MSNSNLDIEIKRIYEEPLYEEIPSNAVFPADSKTEGSGTILVNDFLQRKELTSEFKPEDETEPVNGKAVNNALNTLGTKNTITLSVTDGTTNRHIDIEYIGTYNDNQ